jgi:hypothetical protein
MKVVTFGPIAEIPVACYGDTAERLWLAMPHTGLCLAIDASIHLVHEGPCSSLGCGPDETLHYRLGENIFSRTVRGQAPGNAKSQGAVSTGTGERTSLVADPLIANHTLDLMESIARDQHGNFWGLATQNPEIIQVIPATATDTWQRVEVPAAYSDIAWKGIIADHWGFIWFWGETCLVRHDPRSSSLDWVAFSAVGLSVNQIASVDLSPEGRLMAGMDSGQVAELDISSDGVSHYTPIIPDPLSSAPVEFVHTDGFGNIWFVSDGYLRCRMTSSGHATSRWRQTARLPSGNHDIFATSHEQTLYIAGGLTHYHGYPAQMHVFDELLGCDNTYSPNWTVATTMPSARCYSGIAVLGDSVWVVGGAANMKHPEDPYGERTPLNTILRYTPAKNCWDEGPNMGVPRIEPVVATVCGRVYAAGGADENEVTLASMESMGLDEPYWRQEPDLPVPMRQFAGCVLHEMLYVCGPEGFFAYDPMSKHWRTDLPQPIYLPQAPLMDAHGNAVWILGGYKSSKTFFFQPENETWSSGPDLPTDQSWGAAASLHGKLMVIGGAHWSEAHDTFIFDDRVFTLIEQNRV